MAMKLFVSATLALATPCAGHKALLQVHRSLRLGQAELQTDAVAVSSTERAAFLSAEAEDRRFWLSEWNTLEAELVRLNTALAYSTSNSSNATLPSVTVNATAKASANATPAAATPAHPAVTNATGEAHHRSLLKGIKMNLNPRSPADLIPALAMLKGMYENGKDRIKEINAREQESKKQFEVRQATHLARIATIEARGKNHTLSAEFVANETKDENRLFSYWERVRDRQHHSFHTSLNIQHGMMQRVKTMIDAYEKAIAGQAGSSDFQKDLASVMGGLALLQQVKKDAVDFCQTALVEVKAERAALSPISMPTPSTKSF